MRTLPYRRRRGSIAVFAALLMIVMFGMLAFALDLGYVQVARTQTQRSADSAAMAAAWELINENVILGFADPASAEDSARESAADFAGYNAILSDDPDLANSDVTIGYLSNPFDPNDEIDEDSSNPPNAVRVRVRRTDEQNGHVRLLFGSVLGVDKTGVQCDATAAFVSNFAGFRAPSNGENLGMLPFAFDLDTWNDMLAGAGTDDWSWDAETGEVVAGPDGILEGNLFPQGTGAPGNRGTVDIGSNNNSTADIARQILQGVSAEDLAFHGGKLELDENGELFLNGDTGISAGAQDELASIKGKPRLIPVFSQVSGPGNNAQFTIVKFVGIRIMEVELTGQMNSKRVVIQPAAVVAKGGVPSQSTELTTYYIFSPPWLVR